MFRSVRGSFTGFVLLASACVAAPASAPLPADADPAEVRAAALQQECRGSRDRMQCYSDRLLAVLDQEGISAAMMALEELGERDQEVRREGHMYAHHLGLAASPSPAEVGETFRQCRPSFQSGCYHGVIQSYFADLTSSGAEIDAEAVNVLCADYRDSEGDRWLLFQCVHGLGHGLTMLREYHLPTALEGCDLLADEWDREGCYGGVFMESIMNATTPHHAMGRPQAQTAESHEEPAEVSQAAHVSDHARMSEAADHAGHENAAAHAGHGNAEASHAAVEHEPFPPLKSDEPLYPCTVLEERYLVACYQMQTSAILFHNRGDIEATARTCDEAPEQYRGYCYLSLGRDISGITLQDDSRARRACDVGDPEYAVWCHIGYVKNLVDLTADPSEALEYCRGAVGDRLKQACYHAVGEQIWVLTNDREEGEKWCGMAEPGQENHCRRGAGLVSSRDLEAE